MIIWKFLDKIFVSNRNYVSATATLKQHQYTRTISFSLGNFPLRASLQTAIRTNNVPSYIPLTANTSHTFPERRKARPAQPVVESLTIVDEETEEEPLRWTLGWETEWGHAEEPEGEQEFWEFEIEVEIVTVEVIVEVEERQEEVREAERMQEQVTEQEDMKRRARLWNENEGKMMAHCGVWSVGKEFEMRKEGIGNGKGEEKGRDEVLLSTS
ncbi:hypothetical protein BDZ91DRAFT_785196 [Kalaharituber pfeilii]|nr:hypothetical protein BDZ91DRAFT_785196 [Kalaharituber pfeilii]